MRIETLAFSNLLTLAATISAVTFLAVPAAGQVITGEQLKKLENSPSRLPDKAIPLQYDLVPSRPQPLLEFGNPYQGTGRFQENIHLFTGAVFQPSVLVWGTLRSAYNGVARDGTGSRRDISEWANRLDLFGELRLSGTERLVVGMRPLDKNGVFSGYNFSDTDIDGDGDLDDSLNRVNGDIQTLFFEGDLGEILRNVDPEDRLGLDWGFSIGRQPLFFQDGVIVDDVIDAIGITRNSLRFAGLSNVRFTAVLGINDINRGNNQEDRSAKIFGLNTELDHEATTIEIDVWGTTSNRVGGDGLYYGIGATQRLAQHYNSTFRLNGSVDLDDSGSAFVDDGVLLTAELSFTPAHTDDLIYLNAFAGFDNYTSAARGPASGGPLGRMGILFASTGIGSAGAPLGGSPNSAVGGSLGWQMFFAGKRRQLVAEIGGRYDRDPAIGMDSSAIAVAGRYQAAIGQHMVFIVDGFAGTSEMDEDFIGTRTELLFKF